MVNVSQEAGAFFQSDAEIAKQKEKAAKYNYTAGEAIKLSSKALEIKVDQVGQHIYVAESGFFVRKISIATSKTVRFFKGHKGPVTSIALSNDKLWTGSWDKTIKQWDKNTGECLSTLEGHTDFVKTVSIVGDHLYSGSSDCFLRKWHINSIDKTCVAAEKKHRRAIETLAPSEDGKYIFSGSSDGTILQWDIATMQVVKAFTGHDTSIYCIRVWEEDLWTASADKTVRRFNIDTGIEDMRLEHPDRVKSIALAGPYIVTGASDDNIRVWDIGSMKLLSTIEGHFDEVSSLNVVGTTLYSASLDCSVRRWSLTTAALEKYNDEALLKMLEREKKRKEDEENNAASKMTEEEERELAELMLSDDDD